MAIFAMILLIVIFGGISTALFLFGNSIAYDNTGFLYFIGRLMQTIGVIVAVIMLAALTIWSFGVLTGMA